MALGIDKISTTVVAQAIGAGTNDVGALCTHVNVNKWSRWKPIRYPNVVGLTEGDILSVKSGINVLSFSSVTELITFYRTFSNDNYQFDYLRPRGGGNNPSEPYRIGDFRNYEHMANAFYLIESVTATQFKDDNLDIYIGNNGAPSTSELNWSILELSDCHFASVITRTGLSTPLVVRVSDLSIGVSPSNYTRTDLSLSSLIPGRNYEIFSFLCTLDGEGTTVENITSFIPIENNKAGSFLLQPSKVIGTLFPQILGGDSVSGYDIQYTLELRNISATAINVTNVTIRIRYADNTPLSVLQPGEFEFSLGNISVPGNQTVTRTGTAVGAVPQYRTRGGMAYFTNLYNTDINTSASF